MSTSLATQTVPEEAPEELLRRSLQSYRPRLYRLARRAVESREAAEDVVQETIVCALRSRASFDPSRPAGSWLFGILRNQLKNHYARRSRELELLRCAAEADPIRAPEGDGNPESLALENSRTRELHDALQRLPERFAKPLRLYYFRGYDVRSLARHLAISPENAKVRLHRGRRALKELLTV